MSDLHGPPAGRRDFAKAVGLAGLAVLGGVGVAFFLLPAPSPLDGELGDANGGRVAERTVDGAGRAPGGKRAGENGKRAGEDNKRAGERSKRAGESGQRAAAELVGDPGCRIHRGTGAAGDAAAAVVAKGADSRFAVVNGAGAVFTGDLPFHVERAQLGRRGDGALVAAFGGGGDQRQRLAVFLNGRMLADERDVADFGLARDGAEWFLVRPEAGKGLRVEQHDTGAGGRRSFTLTRMRDTGFGLSHTAFYSPVANELIFEPPRVDNGHADSFLLRSPEGKTRRVRPRAVQALVESNAHIYVLEKGRDGHTVSKQAFRWNAEGEDRRVNVWSRTERGGAATAHMFLSDDAAWLGLFGRRLVVFDAGSGEPVLAFPLRGDKQAELARLRAVLGADATVADVGQATDARIAHGLLFLRRTVPSRGGGQARGVVEEVDVFRMDGPRPNDRPAARVAAEDLYRCVVTRAGFPLPAMRVDEAGVAYDSSPKGAGAMRPAPEP